MVVRSFCCVWLSLVFLCGFAFMLTYLIRRRCDTLPHCAPIRRSTDKLSPLTCYIFAQTSVLFPNRCVYSDKVFFFLKKGGVRLPVWMDRPPESQLPFSHYGDCSPSPMRERERERPGALQSFSVLIFTTEENAMFCHNMHVVSLCTFFQM